MASAKHFFESSYKKFGLLALGSSDELKPEEYNNYIKILYLPKGFNVTVNFNSFNIQHDSLFFINTNQYLHIHTKGKKEGFLIYYNRDFYCVQIHDSEVACDGLLFNNLHNIPVTALPGKKDKATVDSLFSMIEKELEEQQPQQEEMLRIYLKQLIILSTRLWRLQQLGDPGNMPNHDIDFFRRFSLLVDIHYKEKHSVADYADMMSIAPKTITHKLRKMNMEQPNEFIKNRIMLEAKRLLIHTAMSAKQIAYHLGYEDPAYFNRLFTLKVGNTPSDFRKKYN